MRDMPVFYRLQPRIYKNRISPSYQAYLGNNIQKSNDLMEIPICAVNSNIHILLTPCFWFIINAIANWSDKMTVVGGVGSGKCSNNTKNSYLNR